MSNECEEWKKRALKEVAIWRDRAEQAEREQDDIKRRFEVGLDERTRMHADLQRAEADNAALLDAINKHRTTRGEEYCQCQGRGTCRACALEKALSAAHPGAALLSEVEALRRFYDAARPFAEATGAKDANVVTDEEWELVYAHAAVDALKVNS